MTYTPEQLKQKTDDEINEIAAVVRLMLRAAYKAAILSAQGEMK